MAEIDPPLEQPSVLPKIVRRFIRTESASGVIMIFFAALALLAANSPYAGEYHAFISAPVSFGYLDYMAVEPLKTWVKDILMVFFFLIVSLELKREICEGFLAKRDQILLPLVAAIGGMAMPALIFLYINADMPQNHAGWAIPSATDIAFALCVLLLAARKIPSSVKIFLLAIAIFDDLGAILIIAAFYSRELAIQPLLMALAGVAALVLLNRKNITSISPYALVGIYLWFSLYNCGIHTTMAGVAVGLAIPMRNLVNPRHSPVNGVMHFLHPWVSFLVLPIFAFTSAGITFDGIGLHNLVEPLPLGIALGLFFGKQIGIFATSWAMIKMKWADKPEGASWLHLYGVSLIAGIGFTMSLFIGILAFRGEEMQEMVKLGVIGGSLLSTLAGYVVLRFLARNDPEEPRQPSTATAS